MADLRRFARALAALRPALDELVDASERVAVSGLLGDVAEISNCVILLEARTFRALARGIEGPAPITTPLEVEIAAEFASGAPAPAEEASEEDEERKLLVASFLSALTSQHSPGSLAERLRQLGLAAWCEGELVLVQAWVDGERQGAGTPADFGLRRAGGRWVAPGDEGRGHRAIARRLAQIASGEVASG